MSYADTIREGFRHVHKNWQLIPIQFVMNVINFVGLLVIVFVPLLVTLIVLGFDPSELQRMEDIWDTLRNPIEFVTQYLGLVLIFLASAIVYMLFAFIVWVFVLGGSAGILAMSVRDSAHKFSMKAFMSEGRRLFWPLAGYVTLVGLMLIGVSIVFIILGGLAAALSESSGLSDSRLALFFKVFFVLSFGTAGISVLVGILLVSLQGLAELVLGGGSPASSLDKAVDSLRKNPRALYLMGILLGIYAGVQVFLALAGYPLQLVPLVGPLLSLPYQVASSLVQGYVCLAMLATVFSHFTFLSPGQTANATPTDAIADSSTRGPGTSFEEVPPRETPPDS